MSNKQTFTYPFNLSNREDYSTVLTQMNDKIDNLKKRVSYFDAYNISGAVVDPQLLDSQLNSLPINQSLVVNASPFFLNGKSYSPGDILLKLSNGEILHIKSQAGGVYYPLKLVKKQEGDKFFYTLQYMYSGAAPASGSKQEINYQEEGSEEKQVELAETISFLNIEESEKSNIYGLWMKVEDARTSSSELKPFFKFQAVASSPDNDTVTRYVKPFLQFYLCTGETSSGDAMPNEQINLDYTLDIEVVGSGDSSVAYWKVGIESVLQNLWVKVK